MIGIDWGSSGFRAYRLSDDGILRERRTAASGIASLTPTDYAVVLQQQIGDWLRDEPTTPVLLSGMVGSRQGWREAAYAECPAGMSELAANFCPVDLGGGRQADIVPGLSCRGANGNPDVMRGEETQIFGLDLPAEATLCMPGTHSKHVQIRDGRIAGFATAMTGEVFALLKSHGLIAAMLAPADSKPEELDTAAFESGLALSGQPGGLLHHIFSVRTRRLFNELSAEAAAHYLSGILIGHELRATAWAGQVVIVGTGGLAMRYRKAFAFLGIDADVAPEDAAAIGLYRLGQLAARRTP
ncbi:2-dehydro-3-deoxygalactonokinase [Ferrovibrio terrae]|uniref:2-dehydro-3-deoxygalactonokinase n=1 Tax=Ferrovibrio terrae TaxID=2594003 RepID=A0A516GWU3_9PROT|nr:2-dehydro-3-deoxygalactonokinase [Ferrovibrio terrae]QDO96008.1 2-dehydro-3-deoxygalactonokinase [Ferrovibrio terrae]